MRGEPGDAMARMKRWEAVRQRLADANGHGGHAVDDIVAAVADAVNHHAELTVTITVDDGADLATVRIVRHNGQVEVTRLQPAPEPPPPHDMPWAGRPVNRPVRPNWEGPDPETLDQTAARLAELIRQDPSLLDGSP